MEVGITGQLFHSAGSVPGGLGVDVIVEVGTRMIGENIRGLDVAVGSGVVTGKS
jgi:hypothetical protein